MCAMVVTMGAVPRSRPLSEDELQRLVAAWASLPPSSGPEHVQHEYLVDVFLTVLDIQMRNVVVRRAIDHYRAHRRREVSSLDDLELILCRHPADREGNRAVAQYLWGNNHWTRVGWLRGLVNFLKEEGLVDTEALTTWAHRSDYRRDFEGRCRYLGLAAYQWLRMRLGVDTVKPDSHLHRFVAAVVGHPVSDLELIRGVTEVARRLGWRVQDLDIRLWEHQRGGPGTI